MSRTAHSPPNSEDMKDPGATKWVAYATRQGLESTLPCSSSLSPRLSESRSISYEQSYRPFSNHGQSYPVVIDTSKNFGHRYFAGCHTDFKCLWTLPAQDIRVLRIPWNNKPSSPPPSSLVATEEDALIYTKKEFSLQHGNDNHTLNLLSTTASTSGADILKLLQKTKLSIGDDSDKVTPSSDENAILKLLQETKLSSDATSLSADDDDNKNDDTDHPTHDNDNITTTITNITPVSSGSTRYTENNSGLEGLRRRLEQLEKKVQRVRMENQRYRDQCSDVAAAATASESDNNDTTHVPTGANDNLPQEEYLGINADQQSLTTNNQNQHCTMLLESLMMPLDMDEKSVLGHTTPTTTTTITTTTQQIKSNTDQGKKGEGR
ncbi:hypothetical protein K492DRAFT_237417 [Lichtheimia hyalospora FSU 10163]|nr:hypothetical protein K492DRAFT_237417 [Lichtheimia hyalospora FSU 10163]